ncbi:MAG: hypothetical protein FJZ01_07385 [Candidatus Sericytochromatia bacterium]|nr:hypothetical protein [Candidatus Tanganyikabacteria bacterium]
MLERANVFIQTLLGALTNALRIVAFAVIATMLIFNFLPESMNPLGIELKAQDYIGIVFLATFVVWERIDILKRKDIEAELARLRAEIANLYEGFHVEMFNRSSKERMRFFRRNGRNFIEVELSGEPVRNTIQYWEGALLLPHGAVQGIDGRRLTLETNYDEQAFTSDGDVEYTIRYLKKVS